MLFVAVTGAFVTDIVLSYCMISTLQVGGAAQVDVLLYIIPK